MLVALVLSRNGARTAGHVCPHHADGSARNAQCMALPKRCCRTRSKDSWSALWPLRRAGVFSHPPAPPSLAVGNHAWANVFADTPLGPQWPGVWQALPCVLGRSAAPVPGF